MEIADGLSVSVQFTPQAAGELGALGNTVADANLGLHEGYFRVKGSSVWFDVGRFEMDYGEALIIGNLGWHQVARTFEGGRVRIQPDADGFYVDLFLTQETEGHGTYVEPLGAGDLYFTGIYAGLGPLVGSMDFDLYALAQIRPAIDDVPNDPMDPMAGNSDQASSNEVTFGARLKGAAGMLNYRAEAGVQVGKRPGGQDSLAYHGDVELGVVLADKLVALSIEGAYASGDDPTTTDKNEGWNQLYPTAHKFLGLMDVFGARTNVLSGVAHVVISPSQPLKLKLDAHVFTRPEGMTDGYNGFELDTQVAYSFGKGLGLNVLYGLFAPEEDAYGTSDLIHYLEAQFAYNF